MIYQIVEIFPSKRREPLEGYSTMQSAYKKVAKSYSKRNVKIILIPEDIGVGYIIYLADGTPYGEIINESDNFWFVKKYKKCLEPSIFLKTEFENKFIYEVFIANPLHAKVKQAMDQFKEKHSKLFQKLADSDKEESKDD